MWQIKIGNVHKNKQKGIYGHIDVPYIGNGVVNALGIACNVIDMRFGFFIYIGMFPKRFFYDMCIYKSAKKFIKILFSKP